MLVVEVQVGMHLLCVGESPLGDKNVGLVDPSVGVVGAAVDTVEGVVAGPNAVAPLFLVGRVAGIVGSLVPSDLLGHGYLGD